MTWRRIREREVQGNLKRINTLQMSFEWIQMLSKTFKAGVIKSLLLLLFGMIRGNYSLRSYPITSNKQRTWLSF